MRRLLMLPILLALAVIIAARPQEPAPAVVLITLDGARLEEIFGGLDAAIVSAQLKQGQRLEDQPIYKRFWAATPEERRAKLMPFLWGSLMRNRGSIAGDPARGSRVHLTNRHAFSYPGYSEMLVGRAHDDTIRSNDPIRNPYPTVLEFLKREKALSTAQAAVFTSWNVHRAIVEHSEGALTINSGFTTFNSPTDEIRRLSALQFETATPWDEVRHDAYTFRFAMDHLARQRPRLLYLGLGETDDWAHDGRYDRMIEALARTDEYVKQLWTWLEAQPDYRGRTHILITTDHGRGRTPKDWRSHGEDVAGAGETWMAFVSPAMARRGEWSNHPPLATAQVAATLIAWMGADWKRFDPAAAPPIAEP
jgi:hypothetical protein